MGIVDWIHLAQDRDKCRAVVNTVLNLGFYKGVALLDPLGKCWVLKFHVVRSRSDFLSAMSLQTQVYVFLSCLRVLMKIGRKH
jgi:hypothetical protein